MLDELDLLKNELFCTLMESVRTHAELLLIGAGTQRGRESDCVLIRSQESQTTLTLSSEIWAN